MDLVLDSLAPARRRMVLIGLAMVGLTLLGAVGAVVLDRVGGDGAADQAEPGPVIVVPGYGGRVSSVQPMVEALRAGGRDVTVVQPDDGGTGDLRAQAKKLDTVARTAMDQAGAASVDVVGYSAGGVVARLWVRDEGGADLARRVVTVGSPHHGTDVAALALEVAGSCPVACKQLSTDSDLLRRLNAGDETPDGPAWVTVRSTDDQVVMPSESAALDGAIDVVVQDFCPVATTSHAALPADPVTRETLEVSLGSAEPRIPVSTSC